MRTYSLIDSFLMKSDDLLRFLSGNLSDQSHRRSNPSNPMNETELSKEEQRQVTGFMRVNYAGEVCAQALYQGQAFTTKNMELKVQLEKAGLEEQDHLYWCQSRLKELNSHVSFLNPFWYIGSLGLGMLAGWFGDEWSLGFLEETENQVVRHLEYHLKYLPNHDYKTRAILETMKKEEEHHAQTAHDHGAKELPKPIKTLMQFTAKFMTKTAYFV